MFHCRHFSAVKFMGVRIFKIVKETYRKSEEYDMKFNSILEKCPASFVDKLYL